MEYSHDSTTSEEPVDDCKELLVSLPKRKLGDKEFFLYQGFWCESWLVRGVVSFQRQFQARDSDIILATKPKSGTTWLKALVFTIMNRTRYTLSSNSPLLTSNPHQLVSNFEYTVYSKFPLHKISSISSPRLLSTHIPYASLSESVKHSKCRIVYLCRNPFDTFNSFWHFITDAGPDTQELAMEEVFESYCQGVEWFGPFWDHQLGYWKESSEKPNKVLFLKYEDLKEDTVYQVKKLAEFIGCPFSLEEERDGVIEEISSFCSLGNLKDLEVNKTGQCNASFLNKSFFRKGDVGDWVNYFSPYMVERLDKVIQEKISGSGLTFKLTST